MGAVLDTLLRKAAIAAAPIPQGVQRAVAEQAIKAADICCLMAGKVFTFSVLKECIRVFHKYHRIHYTTHLAECNSGTKFFPGGFDGIPLILSGFRLKL